jgi:hypothetical protein
MVDCKLSAEARMKNDVTDYKSLESAPVTKSYVILGAEGVGKKGSKYTMNGRVSQSL